MGSDKQIEEQVRAESAEAPLPLVENPANSVPGRVFQQLDLAISRFDRHRLTDWAAAMTYYSMLSIFPALLVFVSVLGIIGKSITGSIIANFEEVAPSQVRDIFLSTIESLEKSGNTAGILLFVGLATSLYSSSNYIGAFIRAAGIVLEVPEKRRFYKTIPLRLGITVLLMLLIMAVVGLVVLTGPIATEFARATGLDDFGFSGWGSLRWPLIAMLAILVLTILYNLGPNFDERRFKIITPGIVLAVALWLILSLGFNLYVDNFARYNRVYGSLAGVVIFLVWLWLTNVAVLLGLEFDAELRRFKKVHGFSAFSRRRLQ